VSRRQQQNAYVYILAEIIGSDSDGLPVVSTDLKIGIASNVSGRTSTLQTGNPRELVLVGCSGFLSREAALRAETQVHRALSEKRVLGEWFTIGSEEAARLVDAAAAGRPLLRLVK